MQRSLLLMLLMALPFISQSKTTANKSRVVCVVNTNYNATTSLYVPNDSTLYRYTTNVRGGIMTLLTNYGWQYSGKADSAFTYKYSSTSSTYSLKYGRWSTYDGNNNLTVQLTGAYNTITSAWHDSTKITNTYDASNNLTRSTYQRWDTTHWKAVADTAITYTAGNYRATDTFWNYLISTNPNRLNEYTYDSHHNLVSVVTSYWNMTSMMLKPYSRTTYYLNATSYQQDSSLTEYNYSTTATVVWTGFQRHHYTYDASGNVATDTTITWAPSASIWRYSNIAINTYIGSDKTSIMYYSWDVSTSTWTTGSKYTLLYDANHNMKNRIFLFWNVSSSSYNASSKDSNDYNSYNQPTNYSYYTWSSTASNWQPSFNNRYYYETYNDPTGVTTISANADVKLYPSPATDVISLDLKWETPQQAVLVIYDMSGKQWRQWQTEKTDSYHGNIPVSALPAGNYILSIEGADGTSAKQFSVIH